MKITKHYLGLGGITLAAGLLLTPPLLDSVTGLDTGGTVYAKAGENNGNGNGNSSSSGNNGGNGNNNGSGNHGGYGKGTDAGHGHDESGRQHRSEHTGRGKSSGHHHGSLASAMGSLNAGHASANARAKANPNSRVGMIARYEQAVLEGRELSGELAAIDEKMAELNDQREQLQAVDPEQVDQRIIELQNEIAALDPNSPDDKPDLDALNRELNEQLKAALYTKTDLEALEEQIAGLEARHAEVEQSLAYAEQAEADALDAAANKPVTAKVMDGLKALLGLD